MQRRLGDGGVAALVLVVATGSALFVLAFPRPVPPMEMPGLHLDPAAVAAQIAEDEVRAGRASRSELARRAELLYRRQCAAETGPGEAQQRSEERARRLEAAVAALEGEEGAEAVLDLRARTTERAMGELDGHREATAWLGSFPVMLERYHLRESGHMRAPRMAVRALYKARWNASHNRPLADALAPIELEAYWGWLAFGARATAPSHRLEALRHYAAIAGAERAAEARATLLYLSGDGLGAAEAFQEAYEEGGSLRLRNHSLAAVVAASP